MTIAEFESACTSVYPGCMFVTCTASDSVKAYPAGSDLSGSGYVATWYRGEGRGVAWYLSVEGCVRAKDSLSRDVFRECLESVKDRNGCDIPEPCEHVIVDGTDVGQGVAEYDGDVPYWEDVEVVPAGLYREAQRALWFDRVRRAEERLQFWMALSTVFISGTKFTVGFKTAYGKSVARTCAEWVDVYRKIVYSCRAYAERYRIKE